MPDGIQNPFQLDYTQPAFGQQQQPFSMGLESTPFSGAGPSISNALQMSGGYQPDLGDNQFSKFMSGDFMKGMLGDAETGAGGWGGTALSLGKSLYGGYQAHKAGKRAEDVLDFQKDMFSKQFENQRTLINNELRDRDRARQTRDPGYKSTTKFI